MDKIDIYLESAIVILQTKNIGALAALRAVSSIIVLAEEEHIRRNTKARIYSTEETTTINKETQHAE